MIVGTTHPIEIEESGNGEEIEKIDKSTSNNANTPQLIRVMIYTLLSSLKKFPKMVRSIKVIVNGYRKFRTGSDTFIIRLRPALDIMNENKEKKIAQGL